MLNIFKTIRFHLFKTQLEGINYDTLLMIAVLVESTDKIKKQKPKILSDGESPIQKLDKDIIKLYIQKYESNKAFRSLLVNISCSADGLVYMSTKHGRSISGILRDSNFIKENFIHVIDTSKFTAEEMKMYKSIYKC